MGLENTDTIEGLVQSNPTDIDDTNQGDDHIRLVKHVLKFIFPGQVGDGFAIPILATETELNYSVGVTSSIQTQLDDEVTNRIADVDEEEAARIIADAFLQQEIDDLTTASESADTQLQTNIDNEATTRANADTTLQTNIDNETSARIAADANLQSQIDAGEFSSGTKMMFAQTSAPTGWTQDATNDRLLRVVNTAGGGSGGSDNPIDNTHVHQTSPVSLSIAQMPAHTHTTFATNQNVVTTNAAAGGSNAPGVNGNNITSSSSGSGSSHSHGDTGTDAWTPKYVDVIFATKN